MQARTDALSRRTGWAAVAAGPLLMLSVGVELVHKVQKPDGTVTEPVTFTVLVTMMLLGMSCAGAAVLGVSRLHRAAGAPLSRSGRVGARFAVSGAVLHILFAVTAGVTAAVSGKPWEGSFLFFGLGFLALIVGGVLLGVATRRAGVLPGAAAALWAGAAAATVAIVVFADPWHDLGMFGFAASWTALGVALLRRPGVDAQASLGPSAPQTAEPVRPGVVRWPTG